LRTVAFESNAVVGVLPLAVGRCDRYGAKKCAGIMAEGADDGQGAV
jgi:hypothetical protein